MRRGVSVLVAIAAAAIAGGALLSSGMSAVGADGAWVSAGELSGSLPASRAVALEAGDVLVLGSSNANIHADLYDAQTASWGHTQDLAYGHYTGVFVRLADGQVLAAGGQSGRDSEASGRCDPQAVWLR